MKIGLDTSFIVNLLRRRSPHHPVTLARYSELRRSGADLVITDHALLEAFSVMSRAPFPEGGLTPADVEQVLRDHFSKTPIAAIRPGLAWDTIRHTLAHGYWGGRVYDAAIALATYEAGARVLLTWNVRHFHSVAPAGLEVREP